MKGLLLKCDRSETEKGGLLWSKPGSQAVIVYYKNVTPDVTFLSRLTLHSSRSNNSKEKSIDNNVQKAE